MSEWANLFVRWFHVIAGIMWIGQTYLFNWMERSLERTQDTPENITGELWMVHGGGFYLVQKQKVPKIMPTTLHWFKWEAGLTWLSGFLLLAIVYYAGGLQLELDSELSNAAGVGIGLATLVGGWLGYNMLWRSPLGRVELVGTAACYAAVVGLAELLSRHLSARAAYMHVGAMFGTIMAANVWLRILPAQQQMIDATTRGEKPDLALAAAAGRCSRHNTYMSVPLVFMMVSNHFPTATYGSAHATFVLAVLVLLGFAAARLVRDGKLW